MLKKSCFVLDNEEQLVDTIPSPTVIKLSTSSPLCGL